MADVVLEPKLDEKTFKELGGEKIRKFRERIEKTKALNSVTETDASNQTKEYYESKLAKEGMPESLKEETALSVGLISGGSTENPESIVENIELPKKTKELDEDEKDLSDEMLLGRALLKRLSPKEKLKSLWGGKDTKVKLVLGQDNNLREAKLIFEGRGYQEGSNANLTISAILDRLSSEDRKRFTDLDPKNKQDEEKIKRLLGMLYLGNREEKRFLGSEDIEIVKNREQEAPVTKIKLFYVQERLVAKFGTEDNSTNELKDFFSFFYAWKRRKIDRINLASLNGRITHIDTNDENGNSIKVSWPVFCYAYDFKDDESKSPVEWVKIINKNGQEEERIIMSSKTSDEDANTIFHRFEIGGQFLKNEVKVRIVKNNK